jgi:four helix bundle protein
MCVTVCVHAKCLEELQIYQKALQAAHAISAILKRPLFQRDPRLRDQLGASSGGVAALIAEGFGQSTDRHFAAFLYRSRGESKETRTHLAIANGRDYLTAAELESLSSRYHEIEKMATGLIRHLEREDRRHRG